MLTSFIVYLAGMVVSVPVGQPLLDMTRSTWSVPHINLTSDNEHNPHSVPLESNNLSVMDSMNTGRNIDKSNSTLPRHNSIYHSNSKSDIKPSMVQNTSVNSEDNIVGKYRKIQKMAQKSNITTDALYIPFEKLSRLRRQANVSTTGTGNERSRVLFLLNSNSVENISALQDNFNGRVLMLVKQPNVSKVHVNSSSFKPLSSEESTTNLHKLIHLGPDSSRMENDLREAKQSLPAIQMISNLNKIDLPRLPTTTATNTSKNFSVTDSNTSSSSHFLPIKSRQLTQNFNSEHGIISPVGNLSNISVESVDHLRMIKANNHPQSRISVLRNQHTIDKQIGTEQNTTFNSRQPSVLSNAKQLWISQPRHMVSQQEQSSGRHARLPVERQLTLQQPVSSSRIRTRLAGTPSHGSPVTILRHNRPLVRAISSRNLHQRRPTRRTVTTSNTQRQGGARIQHRRPSTHRQVTRRRQTPQDPFTMRFSAGFQRGSNLLHQPPLELTSFDGSSNVGFNTLTPLETRLPPLGPPPGLFGGIGLPGLFPGPVVI